MNFNIQKRTLALIMAVLVLPCMLAIPAMADENDTSLFNLLDYGYCVSDLSNRWTDLVPGSRYFYGPLTVFKEMTFEYMDIIFYTDCVFDDLSFSKSYPNVIDLGGGFYRVSGTHGQNRPYFSMNIVSGSFLEVCAWNVSPDSIIAENAPVSATGWAYKYPTNQALAIAGTNQPLLWDYEGYEEWDLYRGSFSLWFKVDEWQAYDYVDIVISFAVADITSVCATIGDYVVPCTINYLADDTTYGYFMVCARVDLSEVNRTLTDPVRLLVQGTGVWDADGAQRNIVTIRSCHGMTVVPEPSLWTTWFGNLYRWLGDGFASVNATIEKWGQAIVNAINPQIVDPGLDDKVTEQGDKLEDMAGSMGAVVTPDIKDAVPNIGGMITIDGPVTLASVFNPFWDNSYFLRMLIGSLSVTLACVVIYGGKK